MKVQSLLASASSNVSGSQSLVGWTVGAVGATSALGVAKVLASSVMAATRSPPISLGSSPGSGAAAEGVWMEGLLEGFSGGTGALPSACAQVSGMFEGESVSLVILLRAEPGAGQVGSELDWDPARGQTWLQQGGPLCRLSLHVLYFGGLRIARMSADVGVARRSEPVVERE